MSAGRLTSVYCLQLSAGRLTSVYCLQLSAGRLASVYCLQLSAGCLASVFCLQLSDVHAGLSHDDLSGNTVEVVVLQSGHPNVYC